MAELLPLFPLPNVVLFPNVFLPLHVFEPRYREMIADALETDRMIGMVLLRPGRARESEANPTIYPIGCSGLITHVERLADGRYNIALRGVERFRIVSEDHSRSYRRAMVEFLEEYKPAPDDCLAIRHQRTKLEVMLAPAVTRAGADPAVSAAMGDADLINALAQYLDLEPMEKQALLEQRSLRTRAESLVELLEMKAIMARVPSPGNIAH